MISAGFNWWWRQQVTHYRPLIGLIGLMVGIHFLLGLGSVIAPEAARWIAAQMALTTQGLSEGKLWQLVTHLLLHDGFWHLFFNCLILFLAGRHVLRQLEPRHFFGIFLCGGILGGVAELAIGGSNTLLLGASGGCLAILIAFTVLLPEMPLMLFPLPFILRAKNIGLGVILFEFMMLLLNWSSDVARIAHLVGALAGWHYVWQLGYSRGLLPRTLAEWRANFARWRSRRRAVRYQQTKPPPGKKSGNDLEDIDAILDKISQKGLHSLTPRERKILEKMSHRMRR